MTNVLLEQWLAQATRRLSKDSDAQVRAEILEHYESALATGASKSAAIDALGDPRAANHQYRKVLLTSAEAKVLQAGRREIRFLSARPGMKWKLLAVPGVLLCAAAQLVIEGYPLMARACLLILILIATFMTPFFLPVNTLWRSRLYRTAKWAALLAAPLIVDGSMKTLIGSYPAYFYLLYVEFVNASIRRKLPVSQWPKMLYL